MSETRPLSIVHGRDKDVIPLLLSVHCHTSTPRILDCTYNNGKMWKGTGIVPVRMDIDSSFDVDYVADFGSMPFDNASFDVLVFDPPHLPTNAASKNSSRMWEQS
jgi:hypothetical protein